jgi:hypothetical protein
VEKTNSDSREDSPNGSGCLTDGEKIVKRGKILVVSKALLFQVPIILARSKKAVTKECPVCLEQIPIRLLSSHLELERSRVEELIGSIGKKAFDPDVLKAMLAEQTDSEVGYFSS